MVGFGLAGEDGDCEEEEVIFFPRNRKGAWFSPVAGCERSARCHEVGTDGLKERRKFKMVGFGVSLVMWKVGGVL